LVTRPVTAADWPAFVSLTEDGAFAPALVRAPLPGAAADATVEFARRALW
jgi:hypothetical protein